MHEEGNILLIRW